jgi:hypothetical protein
VRAERRLDLMQAFNLAYAAAKGEPGGYNEVAEQLVAQMGEPEERET